MRRYGIVLSAALLLGGCGLIEDPTPDEARLTIDGEAGKPVRVIVSTEFVASVDERGQTRVVIFVADTVTTTLPFSRTYRINVDQRFFTETSRLDSDVANVHMQVFVDSRKQFDEGGPLTTGEPFRFVYTFNQAITRDIVVI
jgi:hypothetical protein